MATDSVPSYIGTEHLVNNLPVLSVRDDNYKTEAACVNANAGSNDTFWCVTRNWLDKGQGKLVRAFVTD
jgi:hypothetical protein